MSCAIGRFALAAILALGVLPAMAHAHDASPSFQAGRGGMVPSGHAVAPRSAVIVAPRQRVVVNPAHARTVGVAPQQRAMMAHRHPVFVAPGATFVVPQTPVFFVTQPYASCVWCDELGCVRQTLDFCATFAGP